MVGSWDRQALAIRLWKESVVTDGNVGNKAREKSQVLNLLLIVEGGEKTWMVAGRMGLPPIPGLPVWVQ